VDLPTYERYIIAPIERFDRRKSAFMALEPDNPFGEGYRRQFRARTGHDTWTDPLPYCELDPGDRVGQSLGSAAWRLCREYLPSPLPVTPPEGRIEISDKARITRLIKKAALLFGADRCLTFWAVNKKKWLSCGGRCIAVCPWNKPLVFHHNLVRWMAIHSPAIIKNMLVWADKVVYGRKKSIKRA